MLVLRKIAITGGLASGKSTVLAWFKDQGAYCVSGDKIAHHLLKIHQKRILEAFGTIDRDELGKLVFDDREKLSKLEAVLHPPLLCEIEQHMKRAEKQNCSLFVCEVPILFEKGWNSYFDETITILTNEEVAIERYDLGRAEYKRRMQYQLSPQTKATKSTHVVTNNGTREDLIQQLKEL